MGWPLPHPHEYIAKDPKLNINKYNQILDLQIKIIITQGIVFVLRDFQKYDLWWDSWPGAEKWFLLVLCVALTYKHLNKEATIEKQLHAFDGVNSIGSFLHCYKNIRQ